MPVVVVLWMSRCLWGGKQGGRATGALGEHHKLRPRLIMWLLVEKCVVPTPTLL